MNTITTEGLGHNNPPKDEVLAEQADLLAAACNVWLSDVPEIENEAQATKATDFRERVKAEIKETEAARKAEKEPHRDAAKAVDDRFNPIKEKLAVVEKLFAPLLNGWLHKQEAIRKAEEKRLEDEALEKVRLADEAAKAAEKAAEGGDVVGATLAADEAAKAADTSIEAAEAVSKSTVSVKGNYSARKTGLRTNHSAEIIDFSALLEHCKDRPSIRDALQQIADQWARSPEQRKVPLPGVKLVTSQSV